MALTVEECAEKTQEIYDLTQKLVSAASPVGDWKIAKCYEYALTGQEPPYDINELHQKRQAIRDQINTLQAALEANNKG